MIEPDTDDLTARPWEYPGRAPATSGLLLGGSFLPLTPPPDGDWGAAHVPGVGTLDQAFLLAGGPPIAQRTLVLAVGSNASPAVMRRKFAVLGVDAVVPFVAARVEGLAVGHSAHVSRTGFVAATGFREPGAVTDTFASWLDAEQLACLDATEPNYAPLDLPASELAVHLHGGGAADRVRVYDSHWGALGQPGVGPRPLADQETLYAWLARECEPWRSLVAPEPDDVRATMRRLAGDVAVLEAVRDAWAGQGWAHPTGLAPR